MFRLFIVNSFFILLNIRVCVPQILTYSDDLDEPPFVPRVVNGWPAKHGDVPYQLAFKVLVSRYRGIYMTFCGGTIIGPSKVISAAHCFEEKKKGCEKCSGAGIVSQHVLDKTLAVAGNLQNHAKYSHTDNLEDGQWRKLKSMYIAKSYRFPRNDISVGFTTTPFNTNKNVAPIPYATQMSEYIGKCLVSGYGKISNHQKSDKLLLAHLELMSTSLCSRVHRQNMRKFVCTSSIVSDVQKGDSGGPLVCQGTNDKAEAGNGVLVGVVSGHRYGAGSFFTRVSIFSDFIERGKGSVIRADVVLLYVLHVGVLLF